MKYEKYQNFCLKTFSFLVVKFSIYLNRRVFVMKMKKGKRKVQGVPQSQTAALPRPQEEEETDKSKQAQTEQNVRKALRLALS